MARKKRSHFAGYASRVPGQTALRTRLLLSVVECGGRCHSVVEVVVAGDVPCEPSLVWYCGVWGRVERWWWCSRGCSSSVVLVAEVQWRPSRVWWYGVGTGTGIVSGGGCGART